MSMPSAGSSGNARSGNEYRAAYHGTGATLFTLVFKNLLLTLVTLGIHLPWARTERRKYLWQNTEMDGHRFRYHGTGREMLIGYLKVLVAYALFVGVPMGVARVDQTLGQILQIGSLFFLLPLIPLALYGARRYLLSRTSLRGIRFGLDPGAGGYLKTFLVGILLTVVTFGLYGPVLDNAMHRYVTERTRFGSATFGYDGDNTAAWKIAIKGMLLSVVTLGLYYPWYQAEMARFRIASTYVQGARGRLDLSGSDMFWILVVSFFGTLFSLGLAFPWITTYVLGTIASKIAFVGAVDYAAVARRESTGEAAADGLADALDVGLEV